ncbi:GDSL-type esterase/lipase family protein [Candidatus Magnetominusculus dajiuhuensis]|uniref:GDSL-type esterase/lipase family protein n=1 Tax=Candidatus Magnetominusculus dajiuhuensis TaxID=3137712 RepID=UPI003B433971
MFKYVITAILLIFVILLATPLTAKSSGEKIVFLGDSLTAFADLNEMFPDGNMINRGVYGDTSRDMYNRLGAVIHDAPKKIFIMAGINDIIRGQSVDGLILTYNKILNVLIRKLPNTEIYVISILPVNIEVEPPDLYIKYNLYINTNVIIANEKIKQTVVKYKDKYKIKYLDIYGAFVYTGTIKLNPLFTYDGVHLTHEGYATWKQQIERYVY